MARHTAKGTNANERRERAMLRPAAPGTLIPGIPPLMDEMFSVDVLPPRRAASAAAPLEVQANLLQGAAAPGLLASTRIDTPNGPRAVGSLRAGDVVMTSTGEAATVLWAGRSHATLPAAVCGMTPVHVAAGALGPDAPRHAVVVSAAQTLRLTGSQARFCYGTAEAFVPAAEMVNDRSIRQQATAETVTLVHLMIEGVGTLSAEGLGVESFLPTPDHIAALSTTARGDLFARFPHLKLMLAEPAGRAA